MATGFQYECKTSVAPQQLQTATVQIMHGGKVSTDHYRLLPHMVVWNHKDSVAEAKKTQTCFMVSGFDPKGGDDVYHIAGISLEPIVNGALAAANPHSTARTAVAVGGVVSVAITEEQKEEANMKVGNWLVVTLMNVRTNQSWRANNCECAGTIATATHPKDQDFTNDARVRYIGLIVDDSEKEDENYVRVKLI